PVARAGHPRLPHHEPHIVFRHRVEHAADAAAVLGHQREARVGRIRVAALLRDLGDAHSLVPAVLLAAGAAHHDAFPPAVLFRPGDESLSVLIRSRTAGSRSRSANFAGPPSRAQTGKNALHPWFIAVYGY